MAIEIISNRITEYHTKTYQLQQPQYDHGSKKKKEKNIKQN
jgi:hypothetical protein